MNEETKTPKYDITYWGEELEAWDKRSKTFRKQGQQTILRYNDTGDRARQDTVNFRLNLFHNHITTLLSMLYGSMPKVEVSRRFNDPNDDTSRVAGLMLQRILNADIEGAGEDFASMLRGALFDRLVPGMGQAKVRYEFDKEDVQVPPEFDPDGNTVVEGYVDTKVTDERVPIDYVHWEDFAWSYARNWGEVQWVGFRTRLTKQECIEQFGAEKARGMEYVKTKDDEESTQDKDQEDNTSKAPVWEIWCKTTKTVYFLQKNGKVLLKELPDPLKLSNFWPCPPPMMANCTTQLLMPMPDFKVNQDLYDEIDRLQYRISMITKALKVVGVYDQSQTGIRRMLEEGTENDLIPVENWAMFAEGGGLKGKVDWFPIQEVAQTLERLRTVRNETIMMLYQTTGLQDTLQGQLGGGQPASATEQALRARFASVRVQYLQDDFARFASNLQELKAEVIGRHFDPEVIVMQSQIMVTENQEYVQQATQLIKDPDRAKWSVEIRAESIAMIDYAQLKSERTEYLTALSTFLQSAQAMGKVAPALGPMLLELLKWGLAGFKGSAEIEGVVDRALSQLEKDMQNPQQQQPDPGMEKLKLQIQKDKMKFQQDMQKEMTKAHNELRKMNEELKADLTLLLEKTRGKMMEEAVQAQMNILEKKASGGRGEKSGD